MHPPEAERHLLLFQKTENPGWISQYEHFCIVETECPLGENKIHQVSQMTVANPTDQGGRLP